MSADGPPSINDTLNEMWQEMSGTPEKRFALAAVIIAAQIWHHSPGADTETLLRKAITVFEAEFRK